jgi:branched-chain amino acid transport system substrate-binding protein
MRHPSRRGRYAMVVSGITIAALLSACSTSSSGGSSSGGSASGGSSSGGYQIGMLSDLSANLASQGVPLRDGAETYFNSLNSSGGVNGHKITLTTLDDQSNVNNYIADAEELITSHNVSAILGVLLSDGAVALVPTLQRAQVPAISQGPAAQSITSGVVFGGDAVIANLAPAMLSVAEKLLGNNSAPRIAILNITSTVQDQLSDSLATAVKAKGWNVVATQKVDITATDLTPAASNIAKEKPDLVFMGEPDAGAVLAVRALRQEGVTAPIIDSTAGASLSTLQTLADPNYYALNAFNYSSSPGSGPAQMAASAKAAGYNPDSPEFAHGYVQALVIAAGLKKCGYPCDGKALTTALANLGTVDTHGLTAAPLSYSPSDEAGFHYVQAYHWDKGTGKPAPLSSTPLKF